MKRCRTSPGIRKRLIAIRHITFHGWRRGGGWNCRYAQVWSLEEGKAAENRPLLDPPLWLAWPAQVLERLALSQKARRPSLCSQGVSAGPLLPLWPPVCHAHHWRCSWGDWRRPHSHAQLPWPWSFWAWPLMGWMPLPAGQCLWVSALSANSWLVLELRCTTRGRGYSSRPQGRRGPSALGSPGSHHSFFLHPWDP